jgi:hypothetical protein
MQIYEKLREVPKDAGLYTNIRLHLDISLIGNKKVAVFKGYTVIQLDHDEDIIDVYGLEEHVFTEPEFYLVIDTNKQTIKIRIDCSKSEFLDLMYHPRHFTDIQFSNVMKYVC